MKEPIYFQCDDHFNNLKSLFHSIEPFGKWKVSIDFKGSSWSVAVKKKKKNLFYGLALTMKANGAFLKDLKAEM